MVQATVLSRVDTISDTGRFDHTPGSEARIRILNPNEWIARELHDGLLQNLLYLDLELSSISSQNLAQSGDLGTRVEALHEVVRVGIEELRDALGLLRSQSPYRNGHGAKFARENLHEELNRIVDSFNSKFGKRVILGIQNTDWPTTVPRFVGHQVHAIIHEAVSNALRHSNALAVHVGLRNHCKGIAVTVTDNGCGFDTSSTPHGHFGLRIMKERADAIGATLRIASAPGKGTKVRLHIPEASLSPEIG